MSKILKVEKVYSLPAVGEPDIIYIASSRNNQAYYWEPLFEDYIPISYQDTTWILEDSQSGDYTGFSSVDLSSIAQENPHEVLVTFEIAAGSSRNITLSAHFVVRSAEETAMPSWYYDANYNGILAIEFVWTSQLKRVKIITGWTQFKQGTSFTSNDAEMRVYYR